MGDMVHISGTGMLDGIWFVRDRMNPRFRKRIDILVPESIKGGKWEKVILTHQKSFR